MTRWLVFLLPCVAIAANNSADQVRQRLMEIYEQAMPLCESNPDALIETEYNHVMISFPCSQLHDLMAVLQKEINASQNDG